MIRSVLPYLIINVVLLCFCVGISDGQREYGIGNEGYYYDSRYDYLDIDSLLSNKRLVRNYVDCLLSLKPCTPEGKAVRRILPEALRTKCARCTQRQKHNAIIILRRLRDTYPAEWTRLSNKWDPTGDFTRSFMNILESDDNNNIDKPIRTTRSPNISPPSPNVITRFGSEPETTDQRDPNYMGAPSEIKPTVQIYTTGRPIMSSTYQNMITSSSYNHQPYSTTKKPKKTTSGQVTTMKHKPKPIPTSTYYPDYKPVLFKPIYSGTMDLIDHFGDKIIKTTNLVTGLLKNTVRVVAGRP